MVHASGESGCSGGTRSSARGRWFVARRWRCGRRRGGCRGASGVRSQRRDRARCLDCDWGRPGPFCRPRLGAAGGRQPPHRRRDRSDHQRRHQCQQVAPRPASSQVSQITSTTASRPEPQLEPLHQRVRRPEAWIPQRLLEAFARRRRQEWSGGHGTDAGCWLGARVVGPSAMPRQRAGPRVIEGCRIPLQIVVGKSGQVGSERRRGP